MRSNVSLSTLNGVNFLKFFLFPRKQEHMGMWIESIDDQECSLRGNVVFMLGSDILIIPIRTEEGPDSTSQGFSLAKLTASVAPYWKRN